MKKKQIDLNLADILMYYKNMDLSEDEKSMANLAKKEYSKEQEERIRKWLKYQFKVQEYNKWDFQIYMQVWNWSYNTKMSEDLQNIAMALTMGYMTYLASNNGKREIPKNIIEKSEKIYKETEMYNKYLITKKDK